MIRYTSVNQGNDRNRLLHSLPYGSDRSHVTVYVSYDEGETWPVSKCIVPYSSAYSSLCVLPDGTIGLYVEEKQDGEAGYSTVFYNFTLDWLTDGEDTWTPVGISTPSDTAHALNIYYSASSAVIRVEAPDIQELTILNLSGQVVKRSFLGGCSQVEVDVRGLAAGVYVIECKSAQGLRSTAKFVR